MKASRFLTPEEAFILKQGSDGTPVDGYADHHQIGPAFQKPHGKSEYPSLCELSQPADRSGAEAFANGLATSRAHADESLDDRAQGADSSASGLQPTMAAFGEFVPQFFQRVRLVRVPKTSTSGVAVMNRPRADKSRPKID